MNFNEHIGIEYEGVEPSEDDGIRATKKYLEDSWEKFKFNYPTYFSFLDQNIIYNNFSLELIITPFDLLPLAMDINMKIVVQFNN